MHFIYYLYMIRHGLMMNACRINPFVAAVEKKINEGNKIKSFAKQKVKWKYVINGKIK